MTEGSRPSPKSAMKVVMNSRVIMVTAEHYFSYVRLTSENLSLTISDCKSGRKSSKDAKLRSTVTIITQQFITTFIADFGLGREPSVIFECC